ncbi:MAG: hypothetical protein HY704_17350 [Gemmatimonadetes bacterium]|nr:hypothetical protein [Gemmatimonadota bacterium]
MDERLMHCPRCDRQVRIALTTGHTDSHASLPDAPDVVCLDFQEECTESACPVCGVAGIVMGVRLARSELKPERWPTVRATCQGCEQTLDLEVLDRYYAYCPSCGTTNRWALLRGEGDYIVVTRGP